MTDDLELVSKKTLHKMSELYDRIEELEAALKLATDMRAQQKLYFKDRTKDALIDSKMAEVAFDRAALGGMSRMIDLTDRQRVEVMLPAQLMLGVLISGANKQDADYKRALAALIEACDDAVRDVPRDRRDRIARRMLRAHDEITAPFLKEGARADKVGLVVFYWLELLIDSDYLLLRAGGAMQCALDVLLPALEHAARIERLDASAQKSARKFLAHLQQLGYYHGVRF
jgi:hypothetical protein